VLDDGSGASLPAINAASEVFACHALRLVVEVGDMSRDWLVDWFCISCSSEVTDADSVRRCASLDVVVGPLLDSERGLKAALDVARAPPVTERVIEVAEGVGWFADWVEGRDASEGVSAAVTVVGLGELIRLRRGVVSVAILSEMVGAGVAVSDRRTGLLGWLVREVVLAVADGDGVEDDSVRDDVFAGCGEVFATASAATGGGF